MDMVAKDAQIAHESAAKTSELEVGYVVTAPRCQRPSKIVGHYVKDFFFVSSLKCTQMASSITGCKV